MATRKFIVSAHGLRSEVSEDRSLVGIGADCSDGSQVLLWMSPLQLRVSLPLLMHTAMDLGIAWPVSSDALAYRSDPVGAGGVTDVFTTGPGPFVAPLCKRVESLEDRGDPEEFVLQFRLEDGAVLHIPIARDQTDTLSQLLAVQVIRQGRTPEWPKH